MRTTYYLVTFENGRIYTQGTLYKSAEDHAKELAALNGLGAFKIIQSLGHSVPSGWVENKIETLRTFSVGVTRCGYVSIEAYSELDANSMAENAFIDDVNWEDGFGVDGVIDADKTNVFFYQHRRRTAWSDTFKT